MLSHSMDALLNAGYVYVGMDHFALPNDALAVAKRQRRLHRNFQGYSTQPDCDLIGLGVSSIGRIGATYSQNAKTLDDYYDHLDQGRFPVVRGIALSRDDLLRRTVIRALVMGLAGGPHCIAMCGAACAGIGQAAGVNKNSAMWTFQAGRIIGYSALGALTAASIQGLGWLTVQSAALRPVWTLFHVATMLLGTAVGFESASARLVGKGRSQNMVRRTCFGRWQGHTLGYWRIVEFLPCGLLYSALLVASLTGKTIDGAIVMALFAWEPAFP